MAMIANRRRLGMTSRKSSSSLANGISALDRQTGGITARSCQTRDEAAANRVPYIREHDRDDRCRLLRRKNIFGPPGNNNIHFLLHELGNDLGGALAAALCPAKLDRDRTTFDPAEFPQSLHKSFGPSNLHRRRDCAQEANRRQLRRLLGTRRERPRAAAPPSSVMNFRRLMPGMGSLPGAEPIRAGPPVLGAGLKYSES